MGKPVKFNENHSYNGARLRGQVYDDLNAEDIKFLATQKTGLNSAIPLIEVVESETKEVKKDKPV